MGTHICTTVFTVVDTVVSLVMDTGPMDTVVTSVPIPMEPILMVPELGTTEDILVTDLAMEPAPMAMATATAFLALPFQPPQSKLHLLSKKKSPPKNNYRSGNREDILLA